MDNTFYCRVVSSSWTLEHVELIIDHKPKDKIVSILVIATFCNYHAIFQCNITVGQVYSLEQQLLVQMSEIHCGIISGIMLNRHFNNVYWQDCELLVSRKYDLSAQLGYLNGLILQKLVYLNSTITMTLEPGMILAVTMAIYLLLLVKLEKIDMFIIMKNRCKHLSEFKD